MNNLTSEFSNLSSILIANRGEIASRIIRTCRKMGIRAIAVYSDVDRKMPFVREADMAIHIGQNNPSESYLNMDVLIAAAKRSKADAIHPGYGFLSENASFARRCKEEDIVFIGPNPKAIEAMGSKSEAKNLMLKHGVPIVPGYQGEDQSLERLVKEAEAIGYPLLLKATAGGGGKGMRIVYSKKEIEKSIEQAKRESQNAFGNDRLIVEKYVSSGRHIEFQIFGDQHGNAIHLMERECTIQRRYQKVVEESPSPVMTVDLRQKMGEAAVKAAQALDYDNAGTVEFIYDDYTGDFYFLEVNTRLQVEHPVTEEVTGLDLVKMQIDSARGKPLGLNQDDVSSSGYSIEVRLYAEDTDNEFVPVTGQIEKFEVPKLEGVRVESAVESGSEISVFYDPMIAKIIVTDENRPSAHQKLIYVLKNMTGLGTITNLSFLLDILKDSDFQNGKYDTHFIDKKHESWKEAHLEKWDSALIACTLYDWSLRNAKQSLLKSMPSGWRNSFYEHQKQSYLIKGAEKEVKYKRQLDSFEFVIEEESFDVLLMQSDDSGIQLEINGIMSRFDIAQNGNLIFVHNEEIGSISVEIKDRFPAKEREKLKGGYEAPMPSQIVKVLVEAGQKVKSGDGLIVITSMKMENTIEASEDGSVEEVYVEAGQNVEAGHLMLKIE